MKRDSQIALALTGVSLLLLAPSIRLPLSGMVSNPFALGLFVTAVIALYLKGYVLVSIVLAVVGLYLARGYSTPVTREHYTYSETIEDVTTVPEQPVGDGPDTIDLDVANRIVLSQATPEVEVQPALLTYPPSEETLRSLTGA
jgi:hypothetical protein